MPSIGFCHPPPAQPRWLVVCLCAEWCGTCRDYRQPLATLAAQSSADAFAWVDIEDEPELSGEIDIETFPTVMVLEGERVLFYGPVLPGIESLRRLLRALQDNGAQPVTVDGEITALGSRLARAALEASE